MRNTSLLARHEWVRTHRWAIALVASVATTVTAGLILVPSGGAADASGSSSTLVACTAPAWAEGNTYTAGTQVTYNGRLYQALVTHTAWVGAGWNPAATPSLWKDLGACSGTTSPS